MELRTKATPSDVALCVASLANMPAYAAAVVSKLLDDHAALIAALNAVTAERDAARKVLNNFEIQGPDCDGFHNLAFQGRNLPGKAFVGLGRGSIVTQVARALEEDRRAALRTRIVPEAI